MKIAHILLLTLLSIALGTNCTSGNSDIESDQIYNAWQIDRALRNGLPIETMDGLFMTFDKNGKVLSNISGFDTVLYDFEVNDNTLIFDDGEEFNFEISTLNQDSLIVITQIKGVEFNFWFYAE